MDQSIIFIMCIRQTPHMDQPKYQKSTHGLFQNAHHYNAPEFTCGLVQTSHRNIDHMDQNQKRKYSI
jgi:hypothetical protein